MPTSEFEHVAQNWDHLAKTEPYYAVLTDEANRQGPSEYFWQSGDVVASLIQREVALAGLSLSELHACELGSGVGRVAQAMYRLCKSVTGFDVSQTMVEVASKNFPYIPFKHFDGRLEPLSCDLVYSVIVLQHNPPEVIGKMLRTMFSSARHAVWFQLPLPTGEQDTMPAIPAIPMYGVPEHAVLEIGRQSGFDFVAIINDHFAVPGMDSRRYVFTRKNI